MIKHHKYYWKILDGIDFTMCYDKDWFENKVRTYLKDRMAGKNVGGVFMPTEISNTKRTGEKIGKMERLAQGWQDEFPLARIVWLDAKNANEWWWLKEHFQIDEWTDIDLLITSPVWSVGMDIQNKFDLTAGFFNQNLNRIHDGEALFNFLIRERHPKEIITLFHRKGMGRHWDAFKEIFPTTKNTSPMFWEIAYQQYSQIINYINTNQRDKLTFKANAHFRSDNDGNSYQRPEYREFINGLTEVAKDNMLSKAFALQKLPEIAEYYGANVNTIHSVEDERKYLQILKWNIQPYNLDNPVEPTVLKEITTELTRKLKHVPETIQDLNRFKALSRRPEKEIMKEIKKLIGNEMIITNPQFLLSRAFIKLTEHKDRYDALLTENNWKTIDLYQEENAPIKYLEQLLLAVGVEAKLQRGSSTQRRELFADAKGEHSKQFNNWKRTNGADFKAKHSELRHPYFNGNIKNLTYPLYLWNGLNNGLFTFESLGKNTKKYIEAFTHIVVEGGTNG